MADGALVQFVPAPVRARLSGVLAQPAVRRSLPLLGLVAAAGAALLAWAMITGSPQRPLAGLAESDKAAAMTTLGGAGIAASVDPASGALTVDSDQYFRARMLLAAAGLPKAAPAADAALDNLPLGASHAVEAAHLRDVRDGDLARMIESIDGVEKARVHVADADDSPFLRDAAPSRASVMLTLAGGRTLSPGQAQAIVHLVASSAADLNPDLVSVVDQRGRLLAGAAGDPEVAEAARHIDVQTRVEARYREALGNLLTPIVGAEGFTAEVHADLDFSESQSTRQTYPESEARVRQEETRWTAGAGDAPVIGIPGALSNTPPPASQISTSPPAAASPVAAVPGRTSENQSRSYQLGSEVSVTKGAVGTLKRLTVAVALAQGAKPRPARELASLEALVKQAVGFDATRGDAVTVAARPFIVADQPAPSWISTLPIEKTGRIVAALAAIALLVFGVARPVMRAWLADQRERRAALGPLIAEEIERQQGGEHVTLDMINAAPGYAARADLVREFVTQDPKRAAAVVRRLLDGAEAGHG